MNKPLSDADLIQLLAEKEAFNDFWCYRQYINNPKTFKRGWWNKLLAYELQQWYEDYVEGKRPQLVIQAPPQHGKSEMVVDFISWVCGKNPDLRTIFASFSDRLGIRANLKLQRIFDSKKYKRVFPNTKINTSNYVTVSNQKLRNREIIEFVEAEGFFRNTTVRGAITGEGLDVGIIDDPIKGRAEAGSKTVRDSTWDWLVDDFFTRFSEFAGFVTILTRWHVDDPVGRMIAEFPDLRVVSYPAIATEDEDHRKEGDALFPEHKSIDFLLQRKAVMSTTGWESLYQQKPIVPGGEVIKGEWFGRFKEFQPRYDYRKIYVDTAQKTKEHNDYTVFMEVAKRLDGQIDIITIKRGKMDATKLRRTANDFWNSCAGRDVTKFGALREMVVEDKSSGTGLIQEIKNNTSNPIPVRGIERSIDKYTRVGDVVNYIETGYVNIPSDAHWVAEFISECEEFSADDTHAFDDQIDPLCDAINDMLATRSRGVLDI